MILFAILTRSEDPLFVILDDNKVREFFFFVNCNITQTRTYARIHIRAHLFESVVRLSIQICKFRRRFWEKKLYLACVDYAFICKNTLRGFSNKGSFSSEQVAFFAGPDV